MSRYLASTWATLVFISIHPGKVAGWNPLGLSSFASPPPAAAGAGVGAPTTAAAPSRRSSLAPTAAAHALGSASSSTSSSASSTAAVRRPWFDPTTVMPPHTWRPFPSTEVKLRPDVSAKGFSAVNAFFFSCLSKIAYATEDEARGLLVGNATNAGLGFDRFYWFEGGEIARKSPFDEIHDTDAFIAANDNLIAVVFRGTMGVDDWYTNAMLKPKPCPAGWGIPPPGGTVHTGFDDAVSTVWLSTPGEEDSSSGMYQTIKNLCNEKGKKRKLFLAGHSLGGALATNAAARLAFLEDIDITAIYTIGSPRLFNRAAARHFDSWPNHGKTLKEKYYRCRNNKDPVTIVPGIPYVHVGTEVFIDKYGTISMASMANRLLDQLLWWLRFEYIRGIDDHSTSEYIRLFKQIVLNSRVPIVEKAASVVMDVLGDLVLKRIAPNPAGNNRKVFDGLFKDFRENNEMVDDMFEGMELRGGQVEDCKGKARAASRQF